MGDNVVRVIDPNAGADRFHFNDPIWIDGVVEAWFVAYEVDGAHVETGRAYVSFPMQPRGNKPIDLKRITCRGKKAVYKPKPEVIVEENKQLTLDL